MPDKKQPQKPSPGGADAPPKKRPRSLRPGQPTYRVQYFLGELCEWHFVGQVNAFSEQQACHRGRVIIAEAWPDLGKYVDCAPAIAVAVGNPALPL